jgi:hypothetical protein
MKRRNSAENLCNYCGKRFAKKYLKNFHVFSVHDQIKAHACKEENCDFVAAKLHTLTQHDMALHKKQKPFKCFACDYETSRRQSLQQHLELMHDAQQQQCTVYHQTFRRKKQLKMHIHSKHMQVGQKRASSQKESKNRKQTCPRTKVVKEEIRSIKLEWPATPLPTPKNTTTKRKQKSVIYEGLSLSLKEYRSVMLKDVPSFPEVKTEK